MKVIIEGRSTRQGARTEVVGRSRDVQVVQQNVSGTGRHWSEVATGSPNGLVVVMDISNAGNHNCYVRTLGSAEHIIERLPDQRCVCDDPLVALLMCQK